MREAAIPGYRLSKARRSTKVLVTLALVGLLLALVTAVLLAVSKTGLAPSTVSAYYLGSPMVDEDLLMASSPRPLGELLEVTHTHLMGGSMLLFLLCHLLSLCEMSERSRTAIYVVSFTTFLLTFSLPLGIVYVNGGLSWLFGPSVLAFSASLVTLTVIPLREMWRRRR